jgi:hypothetical protein
MRADLSVEGCNEPVVLATERVVMNDDVVGCSMARVAPLQRMLLAANLLQRELDPARPDVVRLKPVARPRGTGKLLPVPPASCTVSTLPVLSFVILTAASPLLL